MYTLRDEVLGYGTYILPDMFFEGFIYQLKNGDIFLIHHVFFCCGIHWRGLIETL